MIEPATGGVYAEGLVGKLIRLNPLLDYFNQFEGKEGSSSGEPWPPGFACARCGQPLKLGDCRDFDDNGDSEEDWDLATHAGKTLRQVEDELNRSGGAVYSVATSVWNDRWRTKKRVRGRSHEMLGWRDEESESPKLPWTMVIQPGDLGSIRAQRYYHGACYRELLAEQDTAMEQATVEGLKEMLEAAGFDAVVITKTALPEHLRQFMRQGGDLEDELDLDALSGSMLRPGSGETDLFIHPGHPFRGVDGVITNFHLPRSSLLMLVCAFGGRERVLGAYREAVALGYRFYSYGDAMLLL